MSSDLSSVAIPPPSGEETSGLQFSREFPLGFEPLRTEQLTEMRVQSSPVVKDPFCSPLLAPDSMLKGLPPVHIVVRGTSGMNKRQHDVEKRRKMVTLVKHPHS